MEDTLRDLPHPFYGSICSLNPCFNGRYSQRSTQGRTRAQNDVLILVLMEDTLRDGRVAVFNDREDVLILVLMEDTLRADVLPCSMTVRTS